MNGRTYLNLPEIGNWARYNGQQSNWTKLLLRRDPQLGDTSVLVDIRDQTYAVGQSEAAWGIASDCTGTGTGDMSINLTGTPFAYQAVYGTATGFAAFGSVVCGNEQMCTASCGGICGFCGLGLSNVTTSELQVVDDCAFALGVQAWVTTTTVTSTTTLTFTSTTTTFLGNTTTSTTSSLSVTQTSSSSSTSTSSTSSTTTSSTQTLTTTTQVDGYYFYRFTPITVAQEAPGTPCCCAHAVAELYLRNCGADVETGSAVISNPGGNVQGNLPAFAFDLQANTKWRDTNRQPLVIEWPQLTLVDSYSYLTGIDCPGNDPISFQLHGSQDGLYWELLDSRVMNETPPSSWRPAQTEWFTFKNCTPTTTATTITSSSTKSTSSTRTSTSVSSSTIVSKTHTRTHTMSTTTSPEGAFVVLLTFGDCALQQLYPIRAQEDCEAAARQLQLPDDTAEKTAQANRPEGCYLYREQELFMGVNPASQGKGAETSGPDANETRHPICSSLPQPDRVSTSKSSGGSIGFALLILRILSSIS